MSFRGQPASASTVGLARTLGVMNNQTLPLAPLWRDHCARCFPSERSEGEYASVDYAELVSLDTSIAGYVSRVVEGQQLSARDLQCLETLGSDVQAKIQALSGTTREYFDALAELARVAIALSHPRQ